MAQIHPSSLVDPQAKLAENVVVGPFCTMVPTLKSVKEPLCRAILFLPVIRRSVRTTRFMPLQRSVSILRIKNTAVKKLS